MTIKELRKKRLDALNRIDELAKPWRNVSHQLGDNRVWLSEDGICLDDKYCTLTLEDRDVYKLIAVLYSWYALGELNDIKEVTETSAIEKLKELFNKFVLRRV